MVTVYSRQGCHLCEDAVNVLESLTAELNFEIEIIYIDNNPELEHLYTDQVPVIHIDGKHHDYWRVDVEKFKASLAQHRQHQ